LEFPSVEEKVKQFDITELSTAQQATLAEITQSYRQKITEILTPSQQQQFLKKLPDLLFETP
jgi:Spy/CpxP family protein refolding chaperone